MKNLKVFEMFDASRKALAKLDIKVGDCIRLTNNVEYIESGNIGEITKIDDAGHIHIKWLSCSSSLCLIPEADEFEVISKKECDKAIKKKEFNL